MKWIKFNNIFRTVRDGNLKQEKGKPKFIDVDHISFGDRLKMRWEQDLFSNHCEKYDLPQLYEQHQSSIVKQN